MAETLRSTLVRAKLTRQSVIIQTDDEKQYTGTIDDLSEYTVTIRQSDGIMYIPVVG